MISFTLYGRPVPWERLGGGKTTHRHKSDRLRKYQRYAYVTAFRAVNRLPSWKKDLEYIITMRIYPEDRVFADTDNILKAIKDGIQVAAYKNDVSVVGDVTYRHQVDKENPRVVVCLYPKNMDPVSAFEDAYNLKSTR